MSVGDVFNIASLLKRAYDLHKGCKAAPEEIRLASDYVREMIVCLEGVQSNIAENRRSFVHQKSDQAKARTHTLNTALKSCQRSIERQEKVLKKYLGFRINGHVNLYDSWRWSTGGKTEIAEGKADIVQSTNILNIFLQSVSLNALWTVEQSMDIMMQYFAKFELHQQTAPGMRPRSGSNVKIAIVYSLVISRFKKILSKYRWKKRNRAKNGKPNPGGPHRPKKVVRMNSGLAPKRITPGKTAPMKPPRTRSPSPDFYYISSKKESGDDFVPRPIRRSTTIQRIVGGINARTIAPKPADEHFECWKVGVGTLAIGAKIPPKFLRQNRGQAQLRKMGEVFKEAAQYDSKALNAKSASVKRILKDKNEQEAKKGRGLKWYFVAGRLINRDNGTTGMVSVEKSLIVLVRR